MSSRLLASLQHISVAAEGISSLQFSEPREFTNAILHSTDITSLIRDTEPHERALFTTAGASENVSGPKKNTAVGAYIGGDMAEKLRRGSYVGTSKEVDVNLLLEGAEKLLQVYPIPGARERIANLRVQYEHLAHSIADLEETVEQQKVELEELQGSSALDDLEPEGEEEITDEMLEEEMRLIEDLESRKLSMETDLKRMDRYMGNLG